MEEIDGRGRVAEKGSGTQKEQERGRWKSSASKPAAWLWNELSRARNGPNWPARPEQWLAV